MRSDINDDRLVVTDSMKVHMVAALMSKELVCTYLGTSRFEAYVARLTLRADNVGYFRMSGEWKHVQYAIEKMDIRDTRRFVI